MACAHVCRRALETREEVLGPKHPDTLLSVNNLAILLKAKGDRAGAEPLYRCAAGACAVLLLHACWAECGGVCVCGCRCGVCMRAKVVMGCVREERRGRGHVMCGTSW